jgi:photosystem II stability/assembly factor-like uncharacterized protein
VKTVHPSYSFKRKRALQICLVLMLTLSVLQLRASAMTLFTPLQSDGLTWEMVEHDYPGAIFEDVAFLDATHGWVIGQLDWTTPTDVVVLYTDNGGDSWQVKMSEEEQYLMQIDIVDEDTIWITGIGGLFYTTDAGETWQKVDLVIGLVGMSTVEFINATHGWTATIDTLYKTVNGGQTWESVPGWTFDDLPRKMRFLSSSNVWAMGIYGIYHSQDGAETWEQVSNMGGWTLSCVSETEAWAVGDNRLAHMTDGQTWVELPVPARLPAPRVRPPYLTDILFVDADNGWIVGTEIRVMYTPNGGADWYEQSIPEAVSDRLIAVDFVNSTHGWAVGYGGTIIRTTKGNTLGTRLWNGMTDRVFLSVVGVVAIVIIGVVFVFNRRKRGAKSILRDSPTRINGLDLE